MVSLIVSTIIPTTESYCMIEFTTNTQKFNGSFIRNLGSVILELKFCVFEQIYVDVWLTVSGQTVACCNDSGPNFISGWSNFFIDPCSEICNDPFLRISCNKKMIKASHVLKIITNKRLTGSTNMPFMDGQFLNVTTLVVELETWLLRSMIFNDLVRLLNWTLKVK